MKGITCLDPIDQVHDTILTPVDLQSVIKHNDSLGLSPDEEAFEHTYTTAKRLGHDFGEWELR